MCYNRHRWRYTDWIVVSFSDALVDAVRNDFCFVTSAIQNGVAIGSNIYRFIGFDAGADFAAGAAQIWRNVSNIACDRPPDNVNPLFQSPFNGGQCPGVAYQFDWQTILNGSPLSSRTGVTANGPLNVGQIVNSAGGPEKFLTSNGVRLVGSVYPTVSGSEGDTVGINVTNLTRLDGNPDNCGNPQGEGPLYIPDNYRTTPVIDWDDNGTPVQTPVEIIYNPPTLGPGNGISVPIEIVFEPGSSVFGDFNLSTGDINIGPGNSGGDGIGNDDRELPDGEDNEDPESVIVGIRVRSVVDAAASTATEIFLDNVMPNIYAPRIGYVKFEYPLPNGGTSWGVDIPVKTLDQVVWAERPAVTAVARAEMGTTAVTNLIVQKVNQGCCPILTGG